MATRIMEWIDVEALAPRSLHAFDFAVVRLADGSWLTVPVKVAVGNRPRPRLVALAGVHGDEPEGMLSLLDFWDTCDPGRLQGTVILVPVANPPAFAAHQRRSPLDGLDLNRTFPGKADGTPSERLAYRLLHEVIAGRISFSRCTAGTPPGWSCRTSSSSRETTPSPLEARREPRQRASAACAGDPNQAARLKDIPILAVFGDFIEQDARWPTIRANALKFLDAVKGAGGAPEVVDLPKVSIMGDSYMLMMDRNNLEVADVIQKWLAARGLYR